MVIKSKPTKVAVRYSLILVGLILVAIGIIGIIVPGLPTTIFFIAAAACFAKSSPKLHQWLLEHPWFGSIITDWQESRSISKRAKIFALSSMIVAAIYSGFVIQTQWLIILIYVLMVFPFWFVMRLPITKKQ